jgi:hypothetical protein
VVELTQEIVEAVLTRMNSLGYLIITPENARRLKKEL